MTEYIDLVYTKGEAEELQLVKKKSYLENLEKQQVKLKEEADILKAELNK